LAEKTSRIQRLIQTLQATTDRLHAFLGMLEQPESRMRQLNDQIDRAIAAHQDYQARIAVGLTKAKKAKPAKKK